MTLCVAWNVAGRIFLASDSRISDGDKYSDYGIKVVPVPITIFAPSKEGTNSEIAFHKTYGMCFAGSFTGAYVVREFLVIALQKLQYVPTFSDLSFYRICLIVKKFYSHIATNMSEELDYDHSVALFLSGYCPKEDKLLLAKFYIDYGRNLDQLNPNMQIFSHDNVVEFIGSGEDKYKVELLSLGDDNPTTAPLIALRNLIRKGEVPSVGGNIQTGSFDNRNDFSISGIVETIFHDNGLINRIKYCYAGIDMN